MPQVERAVRRTQLKPVPDHPDLLSDYDATSGFWEEVEAIRRGLDRHTSIFLGSMLWRLGLHGGPHEVRSRLDEVEFSVAGNEWCQLSFVFRLALESPGFRRSLSPVDRSSRRGNRAPTLRGIATSESAAAAGLAVRPGAPLVRGAPRAPARLPLRPRPAGPGAPETPCYLDVVLASRDLVGGFSPRIGDRHLRVVAITAFPHASRHRFLRPDAAARTTADPPLACRQARLRLQSPRARSSSIIEATTAKPPRQKSASATSMPSSPRISVGGAEPPWASRRR